MRSFWPCLGLLLTALILPGCSGGSDRPPLHKATGTITFDGKPLPNASIRFLPSEGLLAMGRTDSEGKFSLKTNGQDGAMAGNYQVAISATEEDKPITPEEFDKLSDGERAKRSKSLIPTMYNNPNASELHAEIVANQTNDFKFELKK